MKRNSKLLTLVTALAMVMSTMIMPISVNAEVSETNMFGAMPATLTTTAATTDGGQIIDGTDGGWVLADNNSTVSYDSTAGYATVANGTGNTAEFRYNYANANHNRTYIVSAYIKLTEAGTAPKAWIYGELANSTYNSLTLAEQSGAYVANNAVALTTDKWTYVYAMYKHGDEDTSMGTASATNSNPRERSRRGTHYRFHITENVDYLIKDVKMIDVTDGINLLHDLNPGFESGDIETFSNCAQSSKGLISTDAARTGMYGIKVTSTKDQADARYQNYAHTVNQWYRASAYVRAEESPATDKKVLMQVREGGSLPVVENGAETIITTSWQKVFVEFKLTDSTRKIHFGPRVEEGIVVYVDDFCLEKFTPAAFSATMTQESVGTSTAEIAVNFTTAPVSFNESNVEANGVTVEVSGSGTSYTISLSGLTDGETYSVVLKNVKDAYEQIANGTISVTTNEKLAPVSDNLIVADTVVQEGDRSGHVIADAVDGGWTVTKADEARLDDNVQKTFVSVNPGKTYIVSAKVKNLDSDKTGDTANAAVGIANRSAHAISAQLTVPPVDISGSDWVDVCGVAVIGTGTCDCTTTTCSKAAHEVHFGVETSTSNLSFQVKDLTLIELSTLEYNTDYFAAVKDNGDGTASLFITNAQEESTVYFIAASYDSGKLADAKMGSAVVNGGASVITIDVAESDTVYIWNGNFNPLNKKFFGSNF